MKRKTIIIFVAMLVISTAFSAPSINVKKTKENTSSDVTKSGSNELEKLDVTDDDSKNCVSDTLHIAITPSTRGESALTDETYNIYALLHWTHYVTVYWDPPQGMQICLWVDPNTLPKEATFPECVCGIDSVSGGFDWTPSSDQIGTYEIVFYYGYDCYEPVNTFTITVIVHPYEPEPYETYEIYVGEEWHLKVTAYWDPPQPEKPICLWAENWTLPEGASFPECHCDYGEVTSDLYWTPALYQVGEHIIAFLAGEECGDYISPPYWIKVNVHPPDVGVYFYQVNYSFNDSSQITDSYIGEVIVDGDLLTSYYDIPEGYLNIETPLGWVVQNLYVSSESTNEEVPYVSTGFYLREGPVGGVPVDSIDADISFSSTPMYQPHEVHFYMPYPVGNITHCIDCGYYEPPIPVVFDFNPNQPNQKVEQTPTHPNVQAAMSQCGPAAVANSLQWLEDKYPNIKIPHRNIPGICKTGGTPNPADSLVAHLDKYMERNVVSRTNGQWAKCDKFLHGKLKYLNDTKNDDPQKNEKLGQYIKVKHQSFYVSLQKDITEGTVTSKFKGNIGGGVKGISFKFIYEELEKGEDVEALLTCPRGDGHYVDIIAAGTTGGQKWIKFQSDEMQAHLQDGDNLLFPRGVPGFNVDPTKTVVLQGYVKEVKNGGNYQYLKIFNEPGYGGWCVTFVTTQSLNNPPNKPNKPTGPVKVKPKKEQTYTTNPVKDPDNDKIQQYEWDFNGDGKVDKKTNAPSVTYTWEKKGSYSVKVRARDEYGAVSEWSDPLSVIVPRSRLLDKPLSQFLKSHLFIYQLLQRFLKL